MDKVLDIFGYIIVIFGCILLLISGYFFLNKHYEYAILFLIYGICSLVSSISIFYFAELLCAVKSCSDKLKDIDKHNVACMQYICDRLYSIDMNTTSEK